MKPIQNHFIISGYGYSLPSQIIRFGQQTRYRVVPEKEGQLDLAEKAIQQALAKAGYGIDDIDCLVSTSAVGVQPIPCTAALIHERVAKGSSIPAMDINTTCTSFIAALDLMSFLIEARKYRRVLLVASEVGSLGLNPKQKESYELFSDGAAAVIIEHTTEERGLITSLQHTWSEGAHDTEIRGGLTAYHPSRYRTETQTDFMFDMKGKKILLLSAQKIPPMFAAFQKQGEFTSDELDYIIPHQASRALPLIMDKLGVPHGQFLNLVADYGNMVSVSVPFGLCYALENRFIQAGDTIALMGTAAGMTVHMLALTL